MALEIQDGEVFRLIEGASGLPTLPNVATRVIEATDGPETTVKEVAALTEKDMALSAKVLQIINSPFYGFSRGITCIRASSLRHTVP
jgi:HD-like signal output (HDOD) protein